ncbi:MAG: hypothetical protein HUU50_04365 [Candidatus Brocadiae bacterium]|nr:hypothetical protein [Candidatus Brocadiia bacterium]
MEQAKDLALSQKERKHIAVLFFLALFCLFGLLWLSTFYKQNRVQVQKKEREKKILLQEIKPDLKEKQPTPIQFVEDDSILAQTQDDQYLHTKGFFYLFHKIYASTEKEVSVHDPKFQWMNLVNIEDRPKFRGKPMRIRGTLVDLKKKKFQGDLAQERGLDDVSYWQGAIYDGEHIYLFAIADFPQEYPQKDTVELVGMFYKIWVYETRVGMKKHEPFFIGKKLRFLEEKEPKGTESLNYLFIFFLGILLILVLYNTISDKPKIRVKL